MPPVAGLMVFVVTRQRLADPGIAHPIVMPKPSVANMASQARKHAP